MTNYICLHCKSVIFQLRKAAEIGLTIFDPFVSIIADSAKFHFSTHKESDKKDVKFRFRNFASTFINLQEWVVEGKEVKL